MIGIIPGEIEMAALAAAVEDPGAGAIVTFAGTTRNETHGREVVSLTTLPELASGKPDRVAVRQWLADLAR